MAIILEFKGKHPKIAKTAFLAPNAVLVGDVEVGEHASIWFGAVLRADYGPIRIGDESNIQDNVVVHSEDGQGTYVAPRVTVGHGAILHGCRIDSDCLIGMGAIVLTNAHIGANSMIGAASLVLENFVVPSGMLAAGVPAAVKKPLTGRAAEWLQLGSGSYTELIKSYPGPHNVPA